MKLKLKDLDHVSRAIQRLVEQHGKEAAHRLACRPGPLTDTAVHEARKEFKQIRAALRVLRRAAGKRAFNRENHAFRDAGRPLSELRDATVMIDTLDGLVEHFGPRIRTSACHPLRVALQARRRKIRIQTLGNPRALATLRKNLAASLRRIHQWKLDRRNWPLFRDALTTSHRNARRAMKHAEKKCADAAWHECRKRAKDLRYQLEMLQPLCPDMIGAMADGAHALTDSLGLDHDLAVLREIASDSLAQSLPSTDHELLLALIDERRRALRESARQCAADLFAERPKQFAARLHAYWKERHALSPATGD